MEKILSTIVLILCALFIVLGIGTIIKGDVDGYRETLFMAAYLLFFITTGFLANRLRPVRK